MSQQEEAVRVSSCSGWLRIEKGHAGRKVGTFPVVGFEKRPCWSRERSWMVGRLKVRALRRVYVGKAEVMPKGT